MVRAGSICTLLLLVSLTFTSCGDQVCIFGALNVSSQGTASDAVVLPPGGSTKFSAVGISINGDCSLTTTTGGSGSNSVIWSVSDPAIATVSNSSDETFGTASCVGSGSVFVTATLPADANGGREAVGTATLICD